MTLTEWRLKISTQGAEVAERLTKGFEKTAQKVGDFKRRIDSTKGSINDLKQKLETLENARGLSTSISQIKRFNAEIKNTEHAISKLENMPPDGFFTRLLKGRFIIDGLKNSLVQFAGLAAIGSFGMEVFDTSKKGEAMQNQLSFIGGGKKQGAEDWKYLIESSKSYGLNLESAAEGYTKLAGSTRGTNLAGQKTKEIFEGIATAGTVMHLTTEQQNGTILALSQMLSKGKVSAEELNGQLGERLPGALGIAARAMGMTQGKLMKMMQDGKVMSNDFVVKFAAQLKEEFGPGLETALTSLQAKTNNLNNEFFLLKMKLGEDLKPLFIDIMNLGLRLAKSLSEVVKWVKENKEWLGKLAQVAGLFFINFKLVMGLKIAAMFFGLIPAVEGAATAMGTLNAVMALNPYVLVAMGLTALVIAMKGIHDEYERGIEITAKAEKDRFNNMYTNEVNYLKDQAAALQKVNKGLSDNDALKRVAVDERKRLEAEAIANQRLLDKYESFKKDKNTATEYYDKGSSPYDKKSEELTNLLAKRRLLGREFAALRNTEAEISKYNPTGKNNAANKAIEDTSAAINGGGKEVKQINITIGKFNDGGININTTSLKEGSAEVSNEMLAMFMRIVQGAELTMNG